MAAAALAGAAQHLELRGRFVFEQDVLLDVADAVLAAADAAERYRLAYQRVEELLGVVRPALGAHALGLERYRVDVAVADVRDYAYLDVPVGAELLYADP